MEVSQLQTLWWRRWHQSGSNLQEREIGLCATLAQPPARTQLGQKSLAGLHGAAWTTFKSEHKFKYRRTTSFVQAFAFISCIESASALQLVRVDMERIMSTTAISHNVLPLSKRHHKDAICCGRAFKAPRESPRNFLYRPPFVLAQFVHVCRRQTYIL